MRYEKQIAAIITGLIGLAACVMALPAHGAITANCASHVLTAGIQRWSSWNAVVALPDSNYAAAGTFSGNATFPPAIDSTSASMDAAVAKLDSCGVPIWVRTVVGTGHAYAWAVATDAAGSIYAAGQFSGQAIIGTTTLTNRGLNDAWWAKWDSTGNLLGAWSFGGAASDAAFAIAVRDGVVYVGGQVSGSWNAGGGPIAGDLARQSTAFVARYTSSAGNLLGETHWDSAKDEVVQTLDIASNGDALVGGKFASTLDFTGEDLGSGTTLTSIGDTDWWLARMSADLSDTRWARRFGGPSSDDVGGVELDSAGNIYWAGSFRGVATGVDSRSCASQGCIELMSLTPIGQLRWAHGWGMGDASYRGDTAKSVTVSGDRVWITGAMVNPLDFGTGVLPGPFDYDVFLAELDLAGNALNAVRYPSAFSDLGYGLAAAPGGVLAVGKFTASVDFGCAGCAFTRQPGSNGEAWAARFTDGSVPPTVPIGPTNTPVLTATVPPVPTRTNTEIPTIEPRTPTRTHTCRVLATPTRTPTAVYVPCE